MGHDERGDSRFLSATATTAADSNDFEYGLCSCCADCDVCLCAWCCPCVQFGRNCADLSQDDPASCCCWGLAFLCALGLPLAVPCLLFSSRRRVRREMGYRHRCCTDCCAALFCGCCVLAQDANEIALFHQSDTNHRTSSRWN
jgi:Cys-rich protein (TIGR01571 family)